MTAVSEPAHQESAPPVRRALLAAVSGSFLEWYDFYLFSTAAGLVLPHLFFPGSSPTAGLLSSFGTVAAGVVMRPVGAVLFGHWGDRLGRRRMLLITVLLMGIGTFLIGCLPTYHEVGVWAPALLIALRLVQGVGIGGEFGGGALVALENAPPGRRGMMGSIHQLGTPLGLLASTGVFALVQLLPDSALYSWGWRVPFLLSFLFVGLAFYIRIHLPETRTFTTDTEEPPKVPVLALLRQHPRHTILATGVRFADAVTFNVINVFALAFATTYLDVGKGTILTGFVIGSAVEMAVVPVVGAWSDHIGRRPLYGFGIVVCIIGSFAYFPLLATGSTLVIWLTISVFLGLGTGFMFALQGPFFAELFDTHTRYTGLGVVYQGSAVLISAPTPPIATALAAAFGHSYWPVAFFTAGVCLIALVCLVLLPETRAVDLSRDAA